jgi:protoporphyrinogen oxidase
LRNERLPTKYAIIGAGFTGLALAYDLAKHGYQVQLFELEEEVGGLAGTFNVDGQKLEKFYHHWFTSDSYVYELINDLEKTEKICTRDTKTSIFFGNKFFKLSSPIDLLKFKPLSITGRLRLGILAVRTRLLRNWRKLENRSASDWLISLSGREVYDVVWRPLLNGKFGDEADNVSAVWMWNKLKLRGGSRGKNGTERLAYYTGGFSVFLNDILHKIKLYGGELFTSAEVLRIDVHSGRVTGIQTRTGRFEADVVVVTTPLPVAANLLRQHTSDSYYRRLNKIRYLANICIVLELSQSLSDTYWLNVNDPGFPFVAVIEHTNFENKDIYNGRNIIYLSKYLPEVDDFFQMTDLEVVDFCILHLQRMFPKFSFDWVIKSHVWRGRYAQPIVVKNYSEFIPAHETPIEGVYLCNMAQIYPEDRGTNYAIREGRKLAKKLISLNHLSRST